MYLGLFVGCVRLDLPERTPGQESNEQEEDKGCRPVRSPGERACNYPADMLQTDSKCCLPACQRLHGAECETNPDHSSRHDEEQQPTGKVCRADRTLQWAE